MSESTIFSLMRKVQEINDLLQQNILPDIERHNEVARGLPQNSLKGQGVELILEAQTREYVLDPILNALGWNTGSTDHVLVEATAEPTTQPGNRRFLDYHGHEISSENTFTSLLIVEAKRLSVELPFDVRYPNRIPSLVIEAISTAQPGGILSQSTNTIIPDRLQKPLQIGQFWKDILDTAKDYIGRVSVTETGSPKQFTLTNGKWYLVFKNPHKTFVQNLHDPQDVVVFINLDDVIHRASEFFECLSYVALSDKIPTQDPINLSKFFSIADYPLELCFTVDLSTSEFDKVQPAFAMNIVAQIRKAKGIWIQFKEDNPQVSKVIIWHQPDRIELSLTDLESRAESLWAVLTNFAVGEFRLVTALEYELSRSTATIDHGTGYNNLLVEASKKNYLLHIGSYKRPFIQNTNYDDCAFHSWGNCKDDQNNGVGIAALAGQSLDPPAYFPSGSTFHCAHKVVHQKRENYCPIKVVEEFLCCRKCALQERCWPSGFQGFPCQANAV